LNPTRQEEENMEDLLRGVYSRMKEQKVKEKAAKSKVYKENPNPYVAGHGVVLMAVETSEGVWEVTE
jgi:hypothetical protein